jgi:hypothetical protein
MRVFRLLSVVAVALLCCAVTARGAIFPEDRGAWPDSWPAELEPLRETSRTIGVGTGIQENIYEIPVKDRETFERIWPAILKLHTHGGQIMLTQAGDAPHPNWGEILNNKQATVRIYAPSGGFTSSVESKPAEQVDYDALIKEGKALKADASWPQDLVGPNGELPEYVVAKKKSPDGAMTWVAADPHAPGDQPFPGFYFRARIDVELVVDGDIIDLNRTQLPSESEISDQRFEAK